MRSFYLNSVRNVLLVLLFALAINAKVAADDNFKYNYEVLATTYAPSIFTSFSSVSINDLGCVAFGAGTTSRSGIYFSYPNQTAQLFNNTTTNIGSVQLNNLNHIVETVK